MWVHDALVPCFLGKGPPLLLLENWGRQDMGGVVLQGCTEHENMDWGWDVKLWLSFHLFLFLKVRSTSQNHRIIE